MRRYEAIDNTSSLGCAGWELVDTHAVPSRTFAIAMPEADAKRAALALNCHEALLAAIGDALPGLRREYVELAQKYAGTAFEADRAYQEIQARYVNARDAIKLASATEGDLRQLREDRSASGAADGVRERLGI